MAAGTLIVSRSSGDRLRWRSYDIIIDKAHRGSIKLGSQKVFNLEPGRHVIETKLGSRRSFPLEIQIEADTNVNVDAAYPRHTFKHFAIFLPILAMSYIIGLWFAVQVLGAVASSPTTSLVTSLSVAASATVSHSLVRPTITFSAGDI
jgi:hypothetical protein